jgi:hypothetical protein
MAEEMADSQLIATCAEDEATLLKAFPNTRA